MMLRVRLILTLFVSLIAQVPVATAAPESLGFDINDVAVLFPLDAKDQPVPLINLNRASISGTLIPPTVFADLMTQATEEWISAPSGSGILKLDHWYVVGFRYDPCAPGNAIRDKVCNRELRLVAQSKGEFGPADSALHLIYKLGTGLPREEDEVINDLLNLKRSSELIVKISTSGQPLGPHPLLAAAVVQSNQTVPNLFRDFLLKYARPSKLDKLTMMGLRDGSPIDWKFLGGTIVEGRWVQAPIPNLKEAGSGAVELNLGGGSEVFTPLTADKKFSIEAFFNSNPSGVNANLKTLDRAAHSLENPALTDRNTVDCVSCHTATTMRLSNNFAFSAFLAGVTAPVPNRITAFPAPIMLQAHPSHWNLRALGYFGSSPTVSMRTVNEAALTAQKLNTILGLKSPGPDCSQAEAAVMKCFVSSSHLFGTITSAEDCLKACRP